jgi:excinuclease ABC subunit B
VLVACNQALANGIALWSERVRATRWRRCCAIGHAAGGVRREIAQALRLELGQRISRRNLLEKLVEQQYTRQDFVLTRGKFRVRGDTVEVFGIGDDHTIRIELFGDEIDRLSLWDPLRNRKLEETDHVLIFPASHYVTARNRWPSVLTAIRKELTERCAHFERLGKILEKQRLLQRTEFDLEMLELTGTCTGIENYSRHLTGRLPGEPPPTLLDYFPGDSLVFIDESHVTIPQLKAMYRGDRSRNGDFRGSICCAKSEAHSLPRRQARRLRPRPARLGRGYRARQLER